jgi:hypothetical protein
LRSTFDRSLGQLVGLTLVGLPVPGFLLAGGAVDDPGAIAVSVAATARSATALGARSTRLARGEFGVALSGLSRLGW